MAKISKNIKHFRNAAGLTQEILADKISVTRQAVSSWERGVTQPDIDMLIALSENLGVSVEELIYGETKKVGLEKPEKEKRNPFFVVLSVFGALLVSVGLAIIFVSFWDELGDAVKSVFAFVPLFAGFAFYMIVRKKKPDNAVALEGAAVLWTAGYMATNALANSFFNADAGFGNLFLADMLLLVPMVLFTKALLPIMTLFVTTAFFPIYTMTGGHFRATVIELIIIVALYAFAALFVKKNMPEGAVGKTAVTWLALLSGAFIICEIPVYINMLFDITMPVFPAIVTIIPMLLAALVFSGDGAFGLTSVSFPACFLSAAYLSFIALNALLENGDYMDDFGGFILPLIAGAVPLVIAVVRRFKREKPAWHEAVQSALVLFPAAVVLAVGGDFDGKPAGVMLSALSVVFGVLLIIRGVTQLSLARVNTGIIEICFIIGVILFGSELDTVVKGAAVLAAGAMLIAVNRILMRSFAKKNGGEDNA